MFGTHANYLSIDGAIINYTKSSISIYFTVLNSRLPNKTPHRERNQKGSSWNF